MITLILFGLLGCLFLFISYCLGVKKQITLMHDYHYTNVKETDKDVYCKGMSIGFVLLAFSYLGSGYLYYLASNSFASIILLVGHVISIAFLVKIQIKYNGSIM